MHFHSYSLHLKIIFHLTYVNSFTKVNKVIDFDYDMKCKEAKIFIMKK